MDRELLKVYMLSIAVSGLLMLLIGFFLYVFRDAVWKNIRFILPLPPISVAAYIFVVNMSGHYHGRIPDSLQMVFSELIGSTLVVASVFFLFVTANIVIIYLFR